MVALGLLWVTGLGWDAHVPRLCMKGVVISFAFSCMRMCCGHTHA